MPVAAEWHTVRTSRSMRRASTASAATSLTGQTRPCGRRRSSLAPAPAGRPLSFIARNTPSRAADRGTVRSSRLEALLLLVHGVGYLAAVLLVLSPLRAAVFVLVQQGLFGLYLGCCFAPNHKGMPVLEEGREPDYLRRQVLTSRNVRGSRVVDFALGGLNYQIEHHLFPSMPRPSLRRAQPLVRAFCAEQGLAYSQSSVFGSYAEALRHLHAAGAPLRPAATD
jgi:fatty acid desaturase